MSLPSTDRTLRRMVADLAALSREDIAAILNALGADERRVVEGLLRDYAGPLPDAANSEMAEFDPTRFSPWLLERLHAGDGQHGMMERTRGALRECATRLYPLSASSRSRGQKTARRSLKRRAS